MCLFMKSHFETKSQFSDTKETYKENNNQYTILQHEDTL